MNKSYETLLVAVADEIATITLNRPQAINALTLQMVRDISDCLEEFRDRDDVKVVIFKGAGEKGFCAGLDIRKMVDVVREGKSTLMLVEGRHSDFIIRSYPKVIIFQLHGYALGAGFEMALAGDFVIVSEDAQVGTPQINVGIPVELMGALIGQYAGMLRAKKICLLGELMSGKEAASIGLVTEAVPRDRLEARVQEIAKKMAEKDQKVVAATKENIYMWQTENLQYSIDHSILITTQLMAEEGALEKMLSFMDRKK